MISFSNGFRVEKCHTFYLGFFLAKGIGHGRAAVADKFIYILGLVDMTQGNIVKTGKHICGYLRGKSNFGGTVTGRGF